MELIGVPFDLGGKAPGARLGPAAVRLAGLGDVLTHAGIEFHDQGDAAACNESKTVEGGLKNFECARAVYTQVNSMVSSALQKQKVPIVIGGDHSIAIGSLGAAVKHFREDIAVLWIDAHADLNTPGTSPSGNLHGMVLAALLGESSGVTGTRDLQWKTLVDEFAPVPLVSQRVAWLGLRDVDPGEQDRMGRLPHEYTATMSDIDRYGMVAELARFDRWMKNSGVRNLWISFDVDSLDPILAPGTGTAVRGGLTYREMHLLAEILHEFFSHDEYDLVGLDLVEVNPLADHQNVTGKMAVEWIASILGKSILGAGR